MTKVWKHHFGSVCIFSLSFNIQFSLCAFKHCVICYVAQASLQCLLQPPEYGDHLYALMSSLIKNSQYLILLNSEMDASELCL